MRFLFPSAITLGFLSLSIVLPAQSYSDANLSIDAAVNQYEEEGLFPDPSLLRSIKDSLSNSSWIWDSAKNEASYSSSGQADFERQVYSNLIKRIYYLYVENATSLEGIDHLANLYYLELERCTIEDFTPLADSSLWGLEYDESQLSDVPESIAQIKSLRHLALDENNLLSVPADVLLGLGNLQFLDLSDNFLNLDDPKVIEDIQNLLDRGIVVEYEQFPLPLRNLRSRLNSDIDSSSKQNFLRGLELLLSVLEEEEMIDLVSSTGLVDQSFADFTLADLHAESIQKYEMEDANLSEASDLSQMHGFLSSGLLPRLDDSYESFLSASENGEVFEIDRSYSGSEKVVRVDNGDVYMCMAINKGIQGLIRLLTSYDWQKNAKEIENLEEEEQMNVETILGKAKFLEMKDPSQWEKARDAFSVAVDDYVKAMNVIDSRLGQDFLFTIHEWDKPEEVKFRADLFEFKSEIYKDEYLIQADENDLEAPFNVINPNMLFEGKFDPVNQLPQSERGYLAVVGDVFTSIEGGDHTFGGVFPHWTQEFVKEKMLEYEMLEENHSPFETISDLPFAKVWKRSSWLGYFFLPSAQSINLEDTGFLVYHQWLGWIQLISSERGSVWIYDFSDEASSKACWYWTKPTLFPFMYKFSIDRTATPPFQAEGWTFLFMETGIIHHY